MSLQPSLGDLADWLEGRLGPEAAAAIEQRIDVNDEVTARILDFLQRVFAAGRSLSLEAPPPLVSQRLRRIVDSAGSKRRVVARVVSDSRETPQLAGVRGAPADPDHFQLVAEVDAIEVVLDVDVRPDGCAIHGQVVHDGTTPPVFEAVAHGPGGSVRDVMGDDLGGFGFTGLDPAVERIELTNDVLTVIVPLPELSR